MLCEIPVRPSKSLLNHWKHWSSLKKLSESTNHTRTAVKNIYLEKEKWCIAWICIMQSSLKLTNIIRLHSSKTKARLTKSGFFTPPPPPPSGRWWENWFHMDLMMPSNPFPDNSRIIFDRHGEHVKKGVVVTWRILDQTSINIRACTEIWPRGWEYSPPFILPKEGGIV